MPASKSLILYKEVNASMIKGITLLEVDEVAITIIMDNTIDLFMPSRKISHCLTPDSDRSSPIAEHGFSALIQVKCGDKKGAVLLDAGISPNGILHNMDSLGVDPSDVQAIILSHGHSDHTAGLPNLIKRMGSQKFSLVFHPDACLGKKLALPGGNELDISPPNIADLHQKNITFIEKSVPSLLADNMILVSGEIPRTTDFEKGLPIHYTKRDGKWQHDPLIREDQCVIMNVRGHGLVIVTGCSHSGIINTIRYAQSLTNTEQIYGVLGGFHLTGGLFETIIPPTVAQLQIINPSYLMPCHCTGWSAIHQIAAAMPKAFIPPNVGTTLLFTVKQ
jgi:7,8-dihydropterin-6-yl-methyl-4-(beta-D-ribofuranosyl)aminobenzene 5'-phosphate synthase